MLDSVTERAGQKKDLWMKHESSGSSFNIKKNGSWVSGTYGNSDALLHGLRHYYYEIREPELDPP